MDRLPQQLRASSRILNHALFHQVDGDDLGPRSPKFLQYVAWVSPVESRKGPELAVRALAATPPGVSMVLVGDGPELGRIQRLAASLGVSDRIDFTGRVPHDDALRIIRDAAVVMFTGLREEGGLALAEAMLLGTPVVVLGNGGASVIAGAAVNPDRVSIVAPTTVDGTVRAMAAAVEGHFRWGQEEGGGERLPLIDVGAAQARLAEALEDAVASTGRGST